MYRQSPPRNIRNPPHPLHLLSWPSPYRPSRLRRLNLQSLFPPRHGPLRPRLHGPPFTLYLEPLQQPSLRSRHLQPGPLGSRESDRQAERSFHPFQLRAQGLRGQECRGDGVGTHRSHGGAGIRV